jgi:hypothetical protein
MKSKICTKCHIEKELFEFSKNKFGLFNKHSQCKLCLAKYYAKYYLKNRNKIRKQVKKYADNNVIKIKTHGKQYRLKNKERFKKYIIKYRIINKFKIRKQIQEYTKKRIKIDKKFHLLINLRARLYHAIGCNYKSLSTMLLIGCEIDYLMYYLQSKFTKGMSWDNYGDWHIDHIKPCASFDLSKSEEQRLCFHYTNLQPLWAKDNLRKRAKYAKQ